MFHTTVEEGEINVRLTFICAILVNVAHLSRQLGLQVNCDIPIHLCDLLCYPRRGRFSRDGFRDESAHRRKYVEYVAIQFISILISVETRKAYGLVEPLLPTWNSVFAHISLLWLSWPTFESAPGVSGLCVHGNFIGIVSMICHVSDLAQSMQAVLPRVYSSSAAGSGVYDDT